MPEHRRVSLLAWILVLALPGTTTAEDWGIDWYRIDSAPGCERAAEDPALMEAIPDGASPDPAQRAVVAALAPLTYRVAVRYDGAGNVVYLWLSHHTIFRKEGDQAEKPGITDGPFATIAALPRLRALLVHKQPLTDAAYAVLESWPALEAFSIEYHNEKEWGRVGLTPPPGAVAADFMRFLQHTPKLRTLHLKHLFSLDATRVDELPTYPDLACVELDMMSAGPKCVPFLLRNPTIRDLELHRADLDNEQVAAIVAALPELRRFVLKPGYRGLGGEGVFDASCLAALAGHPTLEVVGLHGDWKPGALPWEGALEALATIPGLRRIEGLAPDAGPAAARLFAQRPELAR